MAHDHDHDHDHGHDHGDLKFVGSRVSDDALETIRATHAALAESLEATRRWSELNDDEKKAAPDKQHAVEKAAGWMPGYHAEGDRCATCGKATAALFEDAFEQGALPYGAFLHALPVHPAQACLDGFAAAQRDLSPRGIDRARRALMRDLERPSPRMTQFLRHDLLAHPPFGLEDWANSVAQANPSGLDKNAMRDIERLMRWVHARLYHG